MGDFKRNSSRFSRGGSSGGTNLPQANQNSGGGFSRGGGRPSGGASRDSGGGSNNQSGGQGNFPFTRIASMSIPKSAEDAARDFVNNELRGSNLSLTAKVYLGKGDQELVLKSGDMLLINFKTGDKDKDFVVGHISVKN